MRLPPPSRRFRPLLAVPGLLALLAVLLPCLVALLPAASAGGRGAREPRLTPKERARVELGRRLFFDPVVSRSGARACASCHDPEHGYSDRDARSKDDIGLTRRHSQTLLDGAHNPTAHWDGEFESLESLITARLNPVSNGKGLASHGASFGDAAPTAGSTGATAPLPGTPAGPRESGGYGDEPSGAPSAPAGGSEPGAPSPPAPSGPEMPDCPPTPDAPPEGDPSDPGYRAPPTDPPGMTAPEGSKEPSAPAAPAPGAPVPAQPQPPPQPPTDDRIDPQAPPPESDPFAPTDDPQIPLDARKLPRVDVTLEHAGRYREAFVAAYGSPDVNIDRLAGAIAAYCRTLASGTSAYDRHVAGEAEALTSQQRQGLTLFTGRAQCAECHVTTPGPDGRALFTDFRYHDTGVAFRAFGRETPLQTRRGGITEADRGREKVSTRPQDRRAFKTPGLRDVAQRGPFFHDGSARTLEDAVRYYATGGSPDPEQSAAVHALTLTDEEIAALVAFLRALSSEERPGLAREAWRARAARTTLTFIDGVGRRMEGLAVKIEPFGDVLPGGPAGAAAPLLLTADARGEVAFAMPPRTHVRVVLPDGLMPRGGDLVPDTCASARIEVPVDGRVRLALHAPESRVLPEVLAAEHVGVMRLPGHPAPRTLLRKVGSVPASPGRAVALYAGWRRTDVPADARLLVPVARGKAPQRLKVDLSGEGLLEVPTP